jgi:hypothetical protein
MLTVTYDGTTIRIYVDGSDDGNTTTTLASTATKILFGNHTSNKSLGFIGTIDEIGMWDRDLSSAEITSLYNSGDGFAYPFSNDKTVSPSAVAVSTSALTPIVSIAVAPAAVSVSTSVITPMFITTTATGTINVGTGLIASEIPRTRYPVEKGLIGGTTRQVGRLQPYDTV